jgi:integrase/ribosomal protein S27AE
VRLLSFKSRKVKQRNRDSKENALSEAEVAMIEKAICSEKQAYLYIMCGVFGMRIGEVIHCNADWFDLTKGREAIKIPRQMNCSCAECKRKRNGVWRPKTRAGARTIPARINLNYFMFAYRFCKGGQKVGNTRSAEVMIRRLGRRAGIEHPVFPHALRATAATRIASLPHMNSIRITNIMGWESIKIADEYIRASGIDVLLAFEPSPEHEDIVKIPSFKKKEEEPPKYEPYKGNESSNEGESCPVCGARVFLKEDDSWECAECGAMSKL